MNAVILLPGSMSMHDTTADYPTVYAGFADAEYDKGQSTVETAHGVLDIDRASRTESGWRLFGWFTAKQRADV